MELTLGRKLPSVRLSIYSSACSAVGWTLHLILVSCLMTSGTSLDKLGRAHCRIAQIQEDFAATFQETFLTSLETLRELMKEYTLQRKKLDSRRYDDVLWKGFSPLLTPSSRSRLTLDAAITKAAKAKKEKEKKDAEDELKLAKAR